MDAHRYVEPGGKLCSDNAPAFLFEYDTDFYLFICAHKQRALKILVIGTFGVYAGRFRLCQGESG